MLIHAAGPHARAIHATADLLGRLRIDAAFVGTVARSAWLGETVEAGAVDVLALMAAQQKGQLAMMASNRGYRVDKDEIDQSEELDLVPLKFVDEEGDVRVHVLVASNALYGRLVAAARDAQFDGKTLRVPTAEDLALLLVVGGDADAVRRLTELPGFDRRVLREKLISIGLGQQAVAE
ncbi:MAG TPA: hypothetical protein VJ276_23610 [Thermoanaerobaculia bacterium]|nr:hypothetical protein [Thermoanaerobaculia bacterium]